jgi:hypothetical protein
MSPGALRILQGARELILEKGWGQNHFAVSPHGHPVAPSYPAAQNFCLVGALERAALDLGLRPGGRRYTEAREKLEHAIGLEYVTITVYNDQPTTTRRKVLARLNKAIHTA